MVNSVRVSVEIAPGSIPDKFPRKEFAKNVAWCIEAALVGTYVHPEAEPNWDELDDVLFSALDKEQTNMILSYHIKPEDNDEHLHHVNTLACSALYDINKAINDQFATVKGEITSVSVDYLEGRVSLKIEEAKE